MEKVRIDKWLWTVRIFKSRSIATQACKSGKIKVSGSKCKPARMVLANDLISVDKKGLQLEFKILEVLKSILGIKNDLTNYILIFDSLKTKFKKIRISANFKCINKY